MRPFAPAMPCVRRFSAAHLHLLAPAATRHPDTQEVCTTTSPLAVSMGWAQKDMKLPAMHRGCHLITHMIEAEVAAQLKQFKMGLAHIFIQHTSASLTINENADPDVRKDMETFLNKVVPEGGHLIYVSAINAPVGGCACRVLVPLGYTQTKAMMTCQVKHRTPIITSAAALQR
eukprot:GHRR01034382.1.p1 GENE.GHRR01034382.1~~GHRR01034382.1.p1  ORF type:complete len:174 (+),score=23.41 GHRR01034382.1:497-1018(+)